MNLVNKEVIHETFGKGNVINYDDSYIKINFKAGDKRFVFPDIFKTYIEFIDKKATSQVKKEIEKKEEKIREKEILLQEEKILEQERLELLEQEKRMKNRKIHPKIQSVFWCESEEEDRVFSEWRVFTGEIKSGKNKGQPRQLARMNQNSACLLTKREDNTPEKDRQIIGVFMADKGFEGKLSEDGYITAHPEYRLKLSNKESEKMLFWNYYIDEKFPDRRIWNSGRQRYFDNIWMAQILHDIVSLREQPQEKEYAQNFLEYFCKINQINKDEIPKAAGSLTYI